MSSLLNKKISTPYIILITVLSVGITFSITSFISNKKQSELESKLQANNSCNYSVTRLDGFKFVKPLMFVDEPCEGGNLEPTEQEINTIIDNYKKFNGVISASVYLREYNTNKWTAINDEEKYEPGSLFKVPVLITYLRMNEKTPGVLDKEITFNQHFVVDKKVAFKDKGIEFGKTYKVRELLRYMIQYSDNNATILLNNNIDSNVLIKLFTDLGLEKPQISASHYYFTVKEYSLFMRALYNAGYLSIDDSEFAAGLLSKCEFKDGIRSGVPENISIAHKFGESGTPAEMQLHESAIVYLKGKTYLLTVMTKGKDNKTLAKLIGDISATVYKNMLSM
ncbi:MAG: serine hydrolase [Flavobacterium sp.]